MTIRSYFLLNYFRLSVSSKHKAFLLWFDEGKFDGDILKGKQENKYEPDNKQ